VSNQPAFPFFCFEGQKLPYPASSFLPDVKLSWGNLTIVNMVEWELTRHSSVPVTPLLYLVFLWCRLLTQHCKSKILDTKCDVEKQTNAFASD